MAHTKKFEARKKAQNKRKSAGAAYEERDFKRNSGSHYAGTNINLPKGDDNDASWYATTPGLLRDVGSISFPYAVGSPINCLEASTTMPQKFNRFPGIMVMPWIPVVGSGAGVDYPLNTAAAQLYTWVRHLNSGGRNYDAPDLMMYVLAHDSIYSYWCHLRRIYGAMRWASSTNRYMPRGIVYALTGSKKLYNDLQSKMSNFREYINLFAYQASSFALPASMSAFTRHAWMNSHVWGDRDSNKAQLFTYRQVGGYVYNGTPGVGEMGRLDTKSWYADSLDELIAIGEEMLNAIKDDEDANIMSGDIMKAFPNALLKYEDTDPTYMILPEFNREVLAQFHNSYTPICLKPDEKTWGVYVHQLSNKDRALEAVLRYGITQTETGLISGIPYLEFDTNEKAKLAWDEFKYLLNEYDEPSPELTIVSTRMVTRIKTLPADSAEKTIKVSTVCTELNLGYHTITIGLDGELETFASMSGVHELNYKICQTIQFDWNPTRYVSYDDTGAESYAFQGYINELDNYTFVERELLDRLNGSALLAEFVVPKVSSSF